MTQDSLTDSTYTQKSKISSNSIGNRTKCMFGCIFLVGRCSICSILENSTNCFF